MSRKFMHACMLYKRLSVPFESGFQAEVAYNMLIVDPEPQRSEVKKTLRMQGNALYM